MTAAGSRYGVIAGSGQLPIDVARSLAEAGRNPFVIRIAGEADAALLAFSGAELPVSHIAHAVLTLKRAGVAKVVMAGGVGRRPSPWSLRVPLRLWPSLPSALGGLRSGDDRLLRLLIALFERHGLQVVGAHEILPEHVAPLGVIHGRSAPPGLAPAIRSGVAAALALGRLDIGQAVVAAGKRVIAVEGLEGTAEMLARVVRLREAGRLQFGAACILVKLAKPGQELRADMPAIGPDTITSCKAAGVHWIFLSAGSAMVLDAANVAAAATEAGISIIGIDPSQWDQEAMPS
jgi:UDP-2,3-diacylglucosamine hydrolase